MHPNWTKFCHPIALTKEEERPKKKKKKKKKKRTGDFKREKLK
jgi:hypothetical protein